MGLKIKTLLFFLITLSVIFFFLLFNDSCQHKADKRKKPNIIFICVDTLRADRLACYGYENIETPNIDSIAEKGVLFSQAVTQVPVTLPSHCSIFTSQNPIVHNVRENGTYRLDNSETTLAEILKENGYRTAAFIGGFPLDSRFGLNQGFEVYDDDLSGEKIVSHTENKIWQGHEFSSFERKAADVIKSAIKWLSAYKEQRFFLFIHLFDPHAPYSPPDPFNKDYKKKRRYDGEVAYVDYSLGELFENLRNWKLIKDALIIFTSDHGESLGEHEYFTHGKKLYEPSMRIPLIISFPSLLPKGKVIDVLVRSIDIMPTILGILGIKPLKKFQGINLMPVISRGNTEKLNLTSYGETLLPKLRFGDEELRSYRTNKWKYIRYTKDNKMVKEELFYLENDPKEHQNLSKTGKGKSKAFSLLLDELIEHDRKISTKRNTHFKMDEETIRKLKSLGYIK